MAHTDLYKDRKDHTNPDKDHTDLYKDHVDPNKDHEMIFK